MNLFSTPDGRKLKKDLKEIKKSKVKQEECFAAEKKVIEKYVDNLDYSVEKLQIEVWSCEKNTKWQNSIFYPVILSILATIIYNIFIDRFGIEYIMPVFESIKEASDILFQTWQFTVDYIRCLGILILLIVFTLILTLLTLGVMYLSIKYILKIIFRGDFIWDDELCEIYYVECLRKKLEELTQEVKKDDI